MLQTNLSVFILLIGLVSCQVGDQEESHSKSTASLLSTYEHANYHIEYPSDWIMDVEDTSSTNFILFAPDVDTAQQIRHNINLVTQDLSSNPMTTREFMNLSLQQLKMLLKDSKVMKNEMLKIGDDSVGHIIHSTSAKGITLSFDQFFWVRKNNAYLLSLTSSQDWFVKNQSRAEDIMKSFAVRDEFR